MAKQVLTIDNKQIEVNFGGTDNNFFEKGGIRYYPMAPGNLQKLGITDDVESITLKESSGYVYKQYKFFGHTYFLGYHPTFGLSILSGCGDKSGYNLKMKKPENPEIEIVVGGVRFEAKFHTSTKSFRANKVGWSCYAVSQSNIEKVGLKEDVIAVFYGTNRYDRYEFFGDIYYLRISDKGELLHLSFADSAPSYTLVRREEAPNLSIPSWDEKKRGPKPNKVNAKGFVIYKYQLRDAKEDGDDLELSLPKNSQILRVETDQNGDTWLWAIINTEAPIEPNWIRRVRVPALEEFKVNMSKGDKIIGLEHVAGFTYMWILDDETEEVRNDVEFRAFKTGSQMPDDIWDFEYIDFYPIYIQMELGLYVFRRKQCQGSSCSH